MTIIINTFDLTQWLSSNSGMIFEAIAWIIGIVVSLIILGIVAELIFSPFNVNTNVYDTKPEAKPVVKSMAQVEQETRDNDYKKAQAEYRIRKEAQKAHWLNDKKDKQGDI